MVREKGRPECIETRLEKEQRCYELLDRLGLEYDRVDHSPAETMEACLAIEEVLGAPICKNLFLCNRQQTDFYLCLIPGSKVFKTKELSKQIGSSRLSFAGAEHMQQLLEGCYVVRTPEELTQCLDALRDGNDPLAQKRQALQKTLLGGVDAEPCRLILEELAKECKL